MPTRDQPFESAGRWALALAVLLLPGGLLFLGVPALVLHRRGARDETPAA